MRQTTLCLATACALGALVAFGAPASACPTTGNMYAEVVETNTLVGTDCWFNPRPNAMRHYQEWRKNCETRLYQNITQCDGSVVKQLIAVVLPVVKTCYILLSTSCTGNKDWQPTPACSATHCYP